MIINHNMQAINAHRQMGANATNAQKSMEKLSSGLRINRAGDDAAGLAISEKMRGQIRGLDQAGRNAQDGISLIQTAEGALNETHSILQRMRELGVQSANDTNTDADRAELQKEINQLTDEINRIAETTEFNTQTLLKGDSKTTAEATGKLTMGAVTAGTNTAHTQATVSITATDSKAANSQVVKLEIDGNTFEYTIAKTAADGDIKAADNAKDMANKLNEFINSNESLKGQYEVTVSGADVKLNAVKGGDYDGTKGTIKNTSGTTNALVVKDGAAATLADTKSTSGSTTAGTGASQQITFTGTGKDYIGKGITIGDKVIEFYDASKGVYEGDALGVSISEATTAADLIKAIKDQVGDKLSVDLDVAGAALTVKSKEIGTNSKVSFEDGGKSQDYTVNLQVGANAGQKMQITIGDMGAKALGVSEISVSSADNAKTAIEAVDAATAKVSAQRAQLGAFQNRLEHTINNLGTSSENLTAAESRIRDVDMAKEMMTMSKENILNQAAQAMLAQANQAPQQVLQLLR